MPDRATARNAHFLVPRPLHSGRDDALRARHFRAETARLAVQSLYDELQAYPKPGLVSLIDNGSHRDMNAHTFVRSMFALRHYFRRIAGAGMQRAPFAGLKALGVAAESAMLAATGGVNTHRGAIFALGMLCAAAGRCHADRVALSPASIRSVLLIHWGSALATHSSVGTGDSHGHLMAQRYQASGAREEAALGFPSVFEVALPALQRTLSAGRGWDCARVDAVFALMAHISDTNVYYRGGIEGSRLVKSSARRFIERGGTARADWLDVARDCHALFVRHRLSPGGAADLLAAACFLHRLAGAGSRFRLREAA
jgi:triphosphoribosyl-dephospho-CoA synthase